MMKIEHPKNISVDFDRYQKKFAEALYFSIEDGLIKVSEGKTVHIYNWSKVNYVDFDI